MFKDKLVVFIGVKAFNVCVLLNVSSLCNFINMLCCSPGRIKPILRAVLVSHSTEMSLESKVWILLTAYT